jgi:hypothetical protein
MGLGFRVHDGRRAGYAVRHSLTKVVLMTRQYEVTSEQEVETRRTDKSVAENDAYILRWLGKRGVTINEVNDDDRVPRVS